MPETAPALRRADDDELSYVESLLEEVGLPSRDVRDSPARFYVCYVEDVDDAHHVSHGRSDGRSGPRSGARSGARSATRVGVGGLEIYGDVGLLRSVAVERSARGRGFGTAVCKGLEARAREEAVETLYLLTTTAADFFADRGYEAVDRAAAPAAIQGTAEFDDLCPATATCMRTSL